jgi:hypothetical protein
LFNGSSAVADVQMLVNSAVAGSTNGQGNYAVMTASGVSTTLRPRLQGGAGAAISALDAAYVLQSLAGLRSLSTAQRLACDVSGNGNLSTLDASLILQRLVGLGGDFPVATLCGGDWVFQPLAATATNQVVVQPSVNGTTCQPGEIRYQPLVADALNQHFLAAAYGDCTGNWASAGGGGAAAVQGVETARARLGRWRRGRAGTMKVPVYLDSSEPLVSAVFAADYDPARWQPRRVQALATLSGALLRSNHADGRLRIAVAAPQPVELGRRPVLMLHFDPISRRRDAAPITDLRVSLGEG